MEEKRVPGKISKYMLCTNGLYFPDDPCIYLRVFVCVCKFYSVFEPLPSRLGKFLLASGAIIALQMYKISIQKEVLVVNYSNNVMIVFEGFLLVNCGLLFSP
jgi:hypothetical protein